MATIEDDSVRPHGGAARLGPGTISYAFVAGFVSILAVMDGHAWLFPARFEYLDIVMGWWVLYLFLYAPAAIASAVLGLVAFRILRGRVLRRPSTLALIYAVSLTIGFALVGAAIGLLAHSATWIVVTTVVSVLVGGLGYGVALAQSYRLCPVS